MTKNINTKQEFALFDAWIKWGCCDQVIPQELLPREFIEAKRIWEWGRQEDEALDKLAESLPSQQVAERRTARLKQLDVACNLVASFVTCSFNTENLDADVSAILQVPEQTNAQNVDVFGLDFSSGELPAIRANARFQFRPARTLSTKIITEWEERNGVLLVSGISFSWNIPEVDDWLLMLEESAGMDFIQMTGDLSAEP